MRGAYVSNTDSRKTVINFDLKLPTWYNVHNLLEEARKNGKEGEAAYHLIGASLQMTFPDILLRNAPYDSAADTRGKPGDFFVGDTAFCVTASPFISIFENYRQTLDDGYRVFVLVPDRVLAAARLNADLTVEGRIDVCSIESFVSQNIEWSSCFDRDKRKSAFRRLLVTYNDRINTAEKDKSMLVEIPRNL
ncbi:MAG TPA: DUF4928 family protein [Thermodesulfovibrionales bacterium]|nr:DUF4928 family protein [Thermodesulfovibrionales bacterium]